MGVSSCFVCHATGQKRCTRCKAIHYCSVDCQKSDWKRHRRTCGQPLVAWRELCSVVQSTTPKGAAQELAKVQNEIQRLECEEKGKRKDEVKSQSEQSPSQPKIRRSRQRPLQPHVHTVKDDDIDYCLENLTHLSCYQLVVWQSGGDCWWKDTIVSQNENLELIISLKGSVLLVLRLLHTLINQEPSSRVSRLISGQNALVIRMPYEKGAYREIVKRPPVDPRQAIRCLACGQELVASASVANVLQLPSGKWEGMDEYLTCCTISSASNPEELLSSGLEARRSVILWDDTSLVVDNHDICSVSVMEALPSYGQPLTTSEDLHLPCWRDASTGGYSVTCSMCCSLLGAQTSESTMRLYRHTCSVDQPGSTRTTIGHFVAAEMLRYADVHGMYSLVIASSNGQQMLMRLVNWDSTAANSTLNTWHNLVKIHYRLLDANESTMSSNTLPLFQQIDWCCPSPSGMPMMPSDTKGQESHELQQYVTMYLDDVEWQELYSELRASGQHLVRPVVEATILAKSGTKANLEKEGLAAILMV